MTKVLLEIRLLLFQSFPLGHKGGLSNVQAIQLQKKQAHKRIRHALYVEIVLLSKALLQ